MEKDITAQNIEDVPLGKEKKLESGCDLAKLSKLSKEALSGYTISELVKKCCLSRSFLSHLLNGKLTVQPSKKSIYKLGKVEFWHDIKLADLFSAAGYFDEAQVVEKKSYFNR